MAGRRDYYEILGVARESTGAELKSAYRKLALRFHPDRNPGDDAAAENFKEASEAYAILSDPEKRALYDRFGHSGVSGSGSGFGQGFDPSVFGEFSGLFENLFGFSGFGGGSPAPPTGSDVVYRMEVSFRDAAFGDTAPLIVSRLETCETCSGSGAAKGAHPRACGACGGRGRQRFSQGFLVVTRPCSTCAGEGRIVDKPCAGCGGEGRRRGTRSLEIRIPAGIETGSRLRLAGEGDAGSRGAPAGDLYVVLTVAEDEMFAREEDDVVLRLDVPFPTLVLGGELQVATLEETEKIAIPRGTKAGAEIRLRGRGFGRLGRRGRGDFVVRIGVIVPDSPSQEEKDVLRQYAELTGAPVESPGVFSKAKKIFK
jgi:molecular chaperone DnaJ